MHEHTFTCVMSPIEARHLDVSQLSPRAVNRRVYRGWLALKNSIRSLQIYGAQLCVYSFLAVTHYVT